MARRNNKKVGWAKTKEYPHARHPARYSKLDNDKVAYVTFTHSDKVEIDGIYEDTIPLTENIDPIVRNKNRLKPDNEKDISYIYPRLFIGKRSALGKEVNTYSLIDEDYKIYKDNYGSLKIVNVNKTSNSKKRVRIKKFKMKKLFKKINKSFKNYRYLKAGKTNLKFKSKKFY